MAGSKLIIYMYKLNEILKWYVKLNINLFLPTVIILSNYVKNVKGRKMYIFASNEKQYYKIMINKKIENEVKFKKVA